MTSLKLRFNTIEIRRFPSSTLRSLCFERLCSLVTDSFAPQQSCIFKYKDDEGDMVTISNDVDLEEAIRIAQTARSPLLTIQVTQIGSFRPSPKLVFDASCRASCLAHIRAQGLPQDRASSWQPAAAPVDMRSAALASICPAMQAVSKPAGGDLFGGDDDDDDLFGGSKPAAKKAVSKPAGGDLFGGDDDDDDMFGGSKPAAKKARNLPSRTFFGQGLANKLFSEIKSAAKARSKRLVLAKFNTELKTAVQMHKKRTFKAKHAVVILKLQQCLPRRAVAAKPLLPVVTATDESAHMVLLRAALKAQFAPQLKALCAMGYREPEAMLPLLVKHNGDLLGLVQELY